MNKTSPHFTFCLQKKTIERLRVGLARGIVFPELRPGAGVKIGDFVQGKLGGLW